MCCHHRYAHQGTTVYKVTKLPEGSERQVGYKDSGWTTYEECSSEQIKKFYLEVAPWKLVLDLGVGENMEGARGWPVGPDDFDSLVSSKQFTNGADAEVVQALYRRMSINQLGGIEQLDFDGMAPPNVQDAHCLRGCLKLCTHLRSIYLNRINMGDDSCQALFAQLGSGALANLIHLTIWAWVGTRSAMLV